MTPRHFFWDDFYNLLINQIGVQIDKREIKVIGQALKNQFLLRVTEPNDRLLQTLPSLFLFLRSLFQLFGSDDPQSDQIITKAFFLLNHD
jgi:hypothetical protein